MKKFRNVFLCILGITLLILSTYPFVKKYKFKPSPSVCINEICSNNKTLIRDGIHDGRDYIELYNSSEEPISLDGYYLSDEQDHLTKFRISNIEIAPKGYVVFYSKHDKSFDEEDPFFFNFGISKNGEKIFFVDPHGNLIDSFYAPAAQIDTVYGRFPDGGSDWKNLEASVGGTNNSVKEIRKQILNSPKFSVESGFYDSEFKLSLSSDAKGKIYYTTDGSKPDEDSLPYKEPIVIKNRSNEENILNDSKLHFVADWNDYHEAKEKLPKGTVIRAVVLDDHGNCSEVTTHTYFVGLDDRYKDSNIISIATDFEELIGENGFFVTGKKYDEWYVQDSELYANEQYDSGWLDHYVEANYWRKGRSWETAANVEFIDCNSEILNQELGLRVHGNYARFSPIKNLQLIAREEYSGMDKLKTELFAGYDSDRILLDFSREKIQFLGFAKDLNLSVQNVIKDCPLFINGEYWYTAQVMEKYDETYFKTHYGIDKLLMIKDDKAAIGQEHYDLYTELLDCICNEEISNEEKVDQLYEMIDMESFIHWLCFNLYLCNDDITFIQNNTCWRSIKHTETPYEDGKWRWMVYDMDHAVVQTGAELPSFSKLRILKENPLYKILRQDERFCKQFISAFMEMTETVFSEENAEKVLAEVGLDMTSYNSFFLTRKEYAIQSLKEEFNLEKIPGYED